MGKMAIFRLFELLVFITWKGVFSFYNIVKDIFVANIALKKRSWKNGHFCTNPWVNLFRIMAIFWSLWMCCFYCLEMRFFVLEYRKRHFPTLFCLKKEVGKMAIFVQKPWDNPFEKNGNFQLFVILVFIA